MPVTRPSPLVLSHRTGLAPSSCASSPAQARQLLRAERGAPVNLARGDREATGTRDYTAAGLTNTHIVRFY